MELCLSVTSDKLIFSFTLTSATDGRLNHCYVNTQDFLGHAILFPLVSIPSH